jgi:hypothetical protein
VRRRLQSSSSIPFLANQTAGRQGSRLESNGTTTLSHRACHCQRSDTRRSHSILSLALDRLQTAQPSSSHSMASTTPSKTHRSRQMPWQLANKCYRTQASLSFVTQTRMCYRLNTGTRTITEPDPPGPGLPLEPPSKQSRNVALRSCTSVWIAGTGAWLALSNDLDPVVRAHDIESAVRVRHAPHAAAQRFTDVDRKDPRARLCQRPRRSWVDHGHWCHLNGILCGASE